MASKRENPYGDSHEAVHPSRRTQVFHNGIEAPKGPRNPPSREVPKFRSNSRVHKTSVNPIKKQIRNVQRKLERLVDLPADVRAEDERALAAYKQNVTAAEVEKARQKRISKYHMVRFFERQKATRQLKKLQKRLASKDIPEEELVKLKANVHVAEVDLNYTQFFPLEDPYVSLYPKVTVEQEGSEEPKVYTDNKAAQPTVDRPKPPMWAEVEKCMEEGTLEQLRDRHCLSLASRLEDLEAGSKAAQSNTSKKVAGTKATANLKAQNNADSSGNAQNGSRASMMGHEVDSMDVVAEGYASDGGFFEE